MKILQSSPQVLIAQESNIGQLFLAVIAVVVGLVVLYGSLISNVIKPSYAPWAGVAFLIMGILVVLNRKVVTLTLDKGSGMASLLMKSLLKTIPSKTNLSEITSVRLFTQSRIVTSGDKQGGYQNERDTSLLFVLRNGQTIDLSDKSQTQTAVTGFTSFNSVPNQEIAQALATFLGVPLEENTPGQLSQTLTSTSSGPLFVSPPENKPNDTNLQ